MSNIWVWSKVDGQKGWKYTVLKVDGRKKVGLDRAVLALGTILLDS